jgi:hypothetical protein
MSYYKTATWLYSLMGIIGKETMNDVFREYYRRWAFRHPSGKDFINVVNDVVRNEHGEEFGPDMNWFFNETLYGTGVCDYKVSGISNIEYHKPVGKTDLTEFDENKEGGSDSLYTSVAQLERTGDVKIPVEVLIHFSNGDEVHEKWDGISSYRDFTYSGHRKILWVKIDPEFKNRMDINFVNNSMTLQPDRVPIRRLVNELTSFVQFFLTFVML